MTNATVGGIELLHGTCAPVHHPAKRSSGSRRISPRSMTPHVCAPVSRCCATMSTRSLRCRSAIERAVDDPRPAPPAAGTRHGSSASTGCRRRAVSTLLYDTGCNHAGREPRKFRCQDRPNSGLDRRAHCSDTFTQPPPPCHSVARDQLRGTSPAPAPRQPFRRASAWNSRPTEQNG